MTRTPMLPPVLATAAVLLLAAAGARAQPIPFTGCVGTNPPAPPVTGPFEITSPGSGVYFCPVPFSGTCALFVGLPETPFGFLSPPACPPGPCIVAVRPLVGLITTPRGGPIEIRVPAGLPDPTLLNFQCGCLSPTRCFWLSQAVRVTIVRD